MNCFSKLFNHNKYNNRMDNYKKDNVNKKVLLIGINYLHTNNQLNGCLTDIYNTYKNLNLFYNNVEFKVLAEKEFIDYTNNSELNDFKNKINDKPTRNNILNGFKWLLENNNNETHLLFHYSGHGSYDYVDSSDEIDHRSEYIIPLDYNENGKIKDNELNELLVNNLENKEKIKLFGLMDCCHSGSNTDMKYSFLSKMMLQNKGIITNPRNVNNWTEEYYTITESMENKKINCVIITGCKDNETSAESYINNKSQGVLSYNFWKIMKGFLARKQGINYKKLLKLLNYNIKYRNNYTQNPMISSYEKCMDNNICIL